MKKPPLAHLWMYLVAILFVVTLLALCDKAVRRLNQLPNPTSSQDAASEGLNIGFEPHHRRAI